MAAWRQAVPALYALTVVFGGYGRIWQDKTVISTGVFAESDVQEEINSQRQGQCEVRVLSTATHVQGELRRVR